MAAGALSVVLATLGIVLQTDAGLLHDGALVACMVALVIAVVSGVGYLYRTSARLRHLVQDLFEWDYIHGAAETKHLESICNLGRGKIGESHASEESLEDRIKVNPSVIQMFEGSRPIAFGSSIRGYAVVYPLSAKYDKRILERTIRSGREIPSEAVTPTNATARCLYVGMILGKDRSAKIYVKQMLRRQLLDDLSRSKRIQRVYGRPATPSGLKLLKQYGFKPIAKEDEIWMVEASALRETLAQSYRS